MDVQRCAPFTISPIRAANSRKARRAHTIRMYSHRLKQIAVKTTTSNNLTCQQALEKN